MRLGVRTVVIAVMVALFFAGCSGSASHRPGLAAKIDGLCAGYPEEMIADGLPAAESRTSDRAHVAAVLHANEAAIKSAYSGLARLEVGPGFGAVWEGTNGGAFGIREVVDFAIVARVRNSADCPTGSRLFASYDGVPLLFAVSR